MLSLKEKLRTKVGAAIYFAPETLVCEPSEKADVWSCGVSLYMLLCGKPPFRGSTDQAILDKIAHKPATFPINLWEGVSIEAISLLRGMLTKQLPAFPCLSVSVTPGSKPTPIPQPRTPNPVSQLSAT